MISFQAGLPSMIELDALAAPLPRNIHDNEAFTETCTALPAALPDSADTRISFLIAKSKLAFAFARALSDVKGSSILPPAKILEIDRKLREVYNDVPRMYQLGALSSQDSLVLISSRFVLASIHHKSLCVVHSRFLEIAKTDPAYLYSRQVCLSSAMTILRFQAVQNQAIPVDGGSRSVTKYQTSLVIHDYLLAATIISAEMFSTSAILEPQLRAGIPTRAEMVRALASSAQIFSEMAGRSIEAYKAADVLRMLVRRLAATGTSATGARRSMMPGSTNLDSTSVIQPDVAWNGDRGDNLGSEPLLAELEKESAPWRSYPEAYAKSSDGARLQSG